MRRNVFVLGLDAFNRALLERARGDTCAFHELLSWDDLRGVEAFPIEELLRTAEDRLVNFGGTVDGIATFVDFPATEMVPLLARKVGVRAPSLEAALRCNHKYWSRLLQREVAPRSIPRFAAFDPYDDAALDRLGLEYPFWVKPVNAFRSHLGFRVGNRHEFAAAQQALRADLPRLAEPLEYVLRQAELPQEIAALGANACIAEEIISGRQCTVEGYVQHGQVHVYGVVDSIRESNRTSFARYQYPSTLPRQVRRRMAAITRRVVAHTGLDDSAFNVEFFYDARRRRYWLLEINTRISQSHAELFERVDGVSHHGVMVDVALGDPPHLPRRQGPFACAAKFFVRAFDDATVEHVPSPEKIRRIEETVPGAEVYVTVTEGTRLAELEDQDSYSYELAVIYLGASGPRDLLQRHRQCTDMLGFDLSPVR